MRFFAPSWKELHKHVYRLSLKIQHDTYKPDLIVAIARGGLTISHILSDFLELPITTFTISTYKDLRQRKSPEIELRLGNKLNNRRILLVDDVSDSGKTFIRGIEYLKALGAEEIKTASVFMKPWAKFKPDYCEKIVKEWIVFPFEARETVKSITKLLKKEGKSDSEIRQLLKKLKISSLFYENN